MTKTRGTREAFIAGMAWANKLGRAKPHWLMYCYPDVIRMVDKDGVRCAWVRNQPGALELIEVEWGPFIGVEAASELRTAPVRVWTYQGLISLQKLHPDAQEEVLVGRAKEDAFEYPSMCTHPLKAQIYYSHILQKNFCYMCGQAV